MHDTQSHASGKARWRTGAGAGARETEMVLGKPGGQDAGDVVGMTRNIWRDSNWTEAMRDESTGEKRPSRRRWMKWEDNL